MRRLHLALALASVGTVTVVACSFPSIGYRDATGAGGAGGSAAHGSASSGGGGKSASGSTSASSTGAATAGSGGGAGTGSGTGGAGAGGKGTGGAGTAGSSTSSTSASTSASSSSGCVGTDPCDCDGDGDPANTPACGGGDCNDHDPLVNSHQMMFFTVPGSNGWDYNCDGKDEYEFTDFLSCGFANCDTSTQKWSGNPPPPDCGLPGPYATCSGNFFVCNNGTDLGMRLQGCR